VPGSLFVDVDGDFPIWKVRPHTARALAAVERPVLLVQGGRDGSVPEKHAHRLLEARGARPTAIAVFDDLQHFYKHAEPGMDPQAAFALATPTDPRVAEAIDRWLRSLLEGKSD
jgi:fermentation-respiration switch protein FrsA (DUF1100 family)